MTSITLTNMDAALKQYYKGENYEEVTYPKRPLFAMLPKKEDFKGRNMPVVLKYGQPQGVGSTFSLAQSQRTASKFEDFLVDTRKIYGVATMDGETIERTKDNEGAFISAMTSEIDGVLRSVSDQLETALFRAGTGAMGQISSGSDVTTATITLASIDDVTNFEVGQTLRVSATDGGAHRTGTEVLAGVNRSAGTLTSTSAAWDTVITAIAAGDYLYVSGNLNLSPIGLGSWIPATAPTTGDSFFGVDRSVDVTRLAGNRYDASSTGETVEEALIEGQGIASREGGIPDVVLMNNRDVRRLVKSVGSRVHYPRSEKNARDAKGLIGDISFKSIQVQGDYGVMDVISCPKAEQGTAWVLQMDTWKLWSVGKAPRILNQDGLTILRQSTSDGYEVRVGMYVVLACNAPGYNCRVTLPPL